MVQFAEGVNVTTGSDGIVEAKPSPENIWKISPFFPKIFDPNIYERKCLYDSGNILVTVIIYGTKVPSYFQAENSSINLNYIEIIIHIDVNKQTFSVVLN